jgi:hypothetical protein
MWTSRTWTCARTSGGARGASPGWESPGEAQCRRTGATEGESDGGWACGRAGRRAPVVCAAVFFGMLDGSVVDAMGVVLFLLSLSPTCRLERHGASGAPRLPDALEYKPRSKEV